MAVLVSDTFTRADNTSVVGAPDVGPTPTTQFGTVGISTNRLYASVITAVVSWPVATSNVDITIARPTSPTGNGTGTGIAFGVNTPTDYWYVQYPNNLTAANNSLPTLNHLMGTTHFKHATFNMPPAAGSGTTLRVVVHNGMVVAFVNGTEIGRYRPEVPIVGTGAGVRFANVTDRFDDLVIADSTAVITTRTGHIYKGRDTAALDTAGAA